MSSKPLKTLIGGIALALATVSANSPAIAEDTAAKGLAIAEEADKRDAGWGDSRVSMKMILHDAHGRSVEREMRSLGLEVADDGDKGLIIFDTPRDVRGSAILSFSHKVGDDDQWLYLPKLKKVKPIFSSNKSGPFMNSEFAYEDIASQEVEKYTYQYIGEEVLEGKRCHVLDRFPVNKNSGYSRQRAWLDQEELRVWKVDYYDRKKSHLKTLTAEGFEQYLGKHWRPAKMEMRNHQTKKRTVLEFNNYQFATGLNNRDFDKTALKRLK